MECCNLYSLSRLESFPGLEELDISSNAVDLRSIPHNLINLKSLTMKEQTHSNFSSLSIFANLSELNLSQSKDIDLVTLPTNLLELRKLRLSCCGLSNVS